MRAETGTSDRARHCCHGVCVPATPDRKRHGLSECFGLAAEHHGDWDRGCRRMGHRPLGSAQLARIKAASGGSHHLFEA